MTCKKGRGKNESKYKHSTHLVLVKNSYIYSLIFNVLKIQIYLGIYNKWLEEDISFKLLEWKIIRKFTQHSKNNKETETFNKVWQIGNLK